MGEILVFLGGAASTLLVQWFVAVVTARQGTRQSLRDARVRIYPEFLADTHKLIRLTSEVKASPRGGGPDPAELNAALAAHRISGSAVQLVSSSAEVRDRTEKLMRTVGDALAAAIMGSESPSPLQTDEWPQLLEAMRKEVGVPRKQAEL